MRRRIGGEGERERVERILSDDAAATKETISFESLFRYCFPRSFAEDHAEN